MDSALILLLKSSAPSMSGFLDDLDRELPSGQPCQMEMSRTEEDPNPVPKAESLSDKLRAHYDKGMNKPKPKMLRGPMAPELVDKIAVPMYLFTVFAGFYVGMVHVTPVINAGDPEGLFSQRCFVVLLVSQMMLNWLGIRYVDSSYGRYLRLHGAPPHMQELEAGAVAEKRQDRGVVEKECDTSSATIMSLSRPGKFGDAKGDNQEKSAYLQSSRGSAPSTTQNGKRDSIGVNLIPAGAMIRQDSLILKQEVELANREMERRNSVMNSRSIQDLLAPSPDVREHPRLTTFSIEDDSSSTERADRSGTREPRDLEVRDDLSSSEVDSTNMGVASSFTCPPPTASSVITKTYPYWSWAPCYDCGRARPPRCHHCPVCKTCVLKRDHHCFFAGACVGYRNHRFFCVFLVWAFWGSVYGTFYLTPYIYNFLWEDMSWADLIFPISALRCMLGYVPLHVTLTVGAVTFMIYFDGLAGLFIYAHSRLVVWGLTSFEKAFIRRSLQIRDTRTLAQKVRAVLGPYWAVNFIVPIHFFTEPVEDPVLWPDIQVFKSSL